MLISDNLQVRKSYFDYVNCKVITAFFLRIIFKRTSTEAHVYMRRHQDAKAKHFDVSNVIYHKFSHGAVSYTLNGENRNVMLELCLNISATLSIGTLQGKQLCHFHCGPHINWYHLMKERICSHHSKFFSLRVDPILGRLLMFRHSSNIFPPCFQREIIFMTSCLLNWRMKSSQNGSTL